MIVNLIYKSQCDYFVRLLNLTSSVFVNVVFDEVIEWFMVIQRYLDQELGRMYLC